MKLPWETDHVWRYIIRSKDRISGVPNNFTCSLPNPIPDTCDKVWVKLQTICLGSFPNSGDPVALEGLEETQFFNSITGLYNTPDSEAQAMGFDTGSYVDLCIEGSTIDTLDTYKLPGNYTGVSAPALGANPTTVNLTMNPKYGICVSSTELYALTDDAGNNYYNDVITGNPLYLNPYQLTASGYTFALVYSNGATPPLGNLPNGFPAVTNGVLVNYSRSQPAKTRGDSTLELLPYNRDKYDKVVAPEETSWVRINSTNLSQLTLKLFNDRGYPLKVRKLFPTGGVLLEADPKLSPPRDGFGAPFSTDMDDFDIDDWACVLLVCAKSKLPGSAVEHKI